MQKSFEDFFVKLTRKTSAIQNAEDALAEEKDKMKAFIKKGKTERIAGFLIYLAKETCKLGHKKMRELDINSPITPATLARVERKYQRPEQDLRNRIDFICNCLEEYTDEEKLTNLQEILVMKMEQKFDPQMEKIIQPIIDNIEAAVVSKNHPTTY